MEKSVNRMLVSCKLKIDFDLLASLVPCCYVVVMAVCA